MKKRTSMLTNTASIAHQSCGDQEIRCSYCQIEVHDLIKTQMIWVNVQLIYFPTLIEIDSKTINEKEIFLQIFESQRKIV